VGQPAVSAIDRDPDVREPPLPPPRAAVWRAAGRALDPVRPAGRAARLAIGFAALAAAIALELPLCPFALVTREPCPGCGLTRATLALTRGHLTEALRFHPLVLVVAPLVIGAGAYNALCYVRGGRHGAAESLQGPWLNRAAIALIVAMLVVWVARFCGAFGGPVPV
jgi:Protein of unknown function (DUF2752)